MLRSSDPDATARDLRDRYPRAVIAVDASRALSCGLMDDPGPP